MKFAQKLSIITAFTVLSFVAIHAQSAQAATIFNNDFPDGRIATGSRPSSSGKVEIETGDDFILNSPTNVEQATFTGLLTNGATISDVNQVVGEIYRVFPNDSNNPPDGRVPTRVNSPSDVALDSRDSTAGELTFSTSVINPSFTVANSVLNGINPLPNQTTGGEGPVTGEKVQFTATFNQPFSLPADHYFFVPQVGVSGGGEFLWLSANRPIVAPGTPFTPDLQSWIRNDPSLAPDWLRIGTDIVGGNPAPTFNAAFSLTGTSVPEPQDTAGVALASLGLGWMLVRKKVVGA
ncbi:MAG: hypothetical protein JO235_07150 [Chroococcidiopsidaceae cyanobacterium CP_BM_RX_35]|nr:hypothetical protein [Chroococcidiopsidaceae cyanobacterium CP_BM_RX_35]